MALDIAEDTYYVRRVGYAFFQWTNGGVDQLA